MKKWLVYRRVRCDGGVLEAPLEAFTSRGEADSAAARRRAWANSVAEARLVNILNDSEVADLGVGFAEAMALCGVLELGYGIKEIEVDGAGIELVSGGSSRN